MNEFYAGILLGVASNLIAQYALSKMPDENAPLIAGVSVAVIFLLVWRR